MNYFEPTAWACIFFCVSGAGSFKFRNLLSRMEGISMNQMSLEQELKSNAYPGRESSSGDQKTEQRQ